MNGTRIIWRTLVWLTGLFRIVMMLAVPAMLVLIVAAHWWTIAICLAVFIGFPTWAYIAHTKR